MADEPTTGECKWLKKVFGRCADASKPSVGAPTMHNAERNLNANNSAEMRDRAAAGNAPINPPGMDKTANAVILHQRANKEALDL